MRDYGGPAPPAANGLTWATAFGTIQAAVAHASVDPDADRILVAAAGVGRAWKAGGGSLGAWGAWSGSAGTLPPRSSTFFVDHDDGEIAFLGGFPTAGGSEVNYVTHPTVLSGDLKGDDSALAEWATNTDTSDDENAFHVVTLFGTTNVTFDGFTIERGNGDDGRSPDPDGLEQGLSGGGIFLYDYAAALPGYPSCGPVVQWFGEVTILNCTVQLNTAMFGGGIAGGRFWPITAEAAIPVVVVRNSTIRANRSLEQGGGIAIGFGKLDIAASIIASNRSLSTAGGVWVSAHFPVVSGGCPQPPDDGGIAELSLINCTVAENKTSGSSGAGIGWENLSPASELFFGSSIIATNITQGPNGEDLWTEQDYQFAALSGCFNCILDPTIEYCATPTGQSPTQLPVPATYDVQDPFFVGAGPHISYETIGVLARDYAVQRCSLPRDLGQPLTSLLPKDTFDVNHNGLTDDWLPDRFWGNRVQPSGYVVDGRVDAGAIEHSETCSCYGDIDADGVVGAADLASLLGMWTAQQGFGTSAPWYGVCLFSPPPVIGAPIAPPACLCLDPDRDGVIGATELSLLLGNWGSCPSYLTGNAEGETIVSCQVAPSGISPADLAALLGFDSIDDFAAWLGALDHPSRMAVLSLLGGAGGEP